MSRYGPDHGRLVREGRDRARVLRERDGAGTPRRIQGAEIHERPAVMPRDPAIVSEERYERQFVEGQRAKGVSWFNIAKMTGKTAPYLRGVYGDGAGL